MNKAYLILAISLMSVSCAHNMEKTGKHRNPAQVDVGNGSVTTTGEKLICTEGDKSPFEVIPIGYRCTHSLELEARSWDELEKKIQKMAKEDGDDPNLVWYRCGAVSTLGKIKVRNKEFKVEWGPGKDMYTDTKEVMFYQRILLSDKNGKPVEEAQSYRFTPVLTHIIPINEASQIPIECTIQ